MSYSAELFNVNNEITAKLNVSAEILTEIHYAKSAPAPEPEIIYVYVRSGDVIDNTDDYKVVGVATSSFEIQEAET